MRNATEGLAKTLRAYVDDMAQSAKRSDERHKSTTSCRSPDIDTQSRDIPASKLPAKPLYSRLLTHLESVDFYEPVLVKDELSGIDKFARYRFFVNLDLPHSVHLFQYHAGSQLGNISYIWKIPESERDRSVPMQNSAVSMAKASLPVYKSRAMRKLFTDRYGHIKELSPVILRSMYRFLTEDVSQELHGSDIDSRLQMMLDDPDADLVLDKRELNPGRQSQFETFWKELDVLLEVYGKSVDDRWHGPHVAQLPLAISIPDLIRQVKERLPAETPIPSETWVRFQFWPRNQFSETAKRYKCRFDVKYKVQRRQLRKTHVDARYCAVLFRYLKEMAVRFRMHAALVFLDDKSKIPIGMYVCVCVCVYRCAFGPGPKPQFVNMPLN